MSFLKLTNANPNYNGETVILNSNNIVCIRRGNVERQDKTNDIVTFVLVPPHGTWEVKETPEEIWKTLKKDSSSVK